MDRREALKKMAVGGATVVGASVVLSNVAFADGGTIGSRPPVSAPTATFAKVSSAVSNINYSFPISTCPFFTPTNARLDIGVSITSITPAPSTTTGTVAPYSLGTSTGNVAPRTGTVTITWSVGTTRTVTLQFDARYVCRSRPGAPAVAWRCGSWQKTFTVNDSNGSLNSETPMTLVGNIAQCDSPAPTGP